MIIKSLGIHNLTSHNFTVALVPRCPAPCRRPGAVARPAPAPLRRPGAAAPAPRGTAGRGHRGAAAGSGQQHGGGAGEEVQGPKIPWDLDMIDR